MVPSKKTVLFATNVDAPPKIENLPWFMAKISYSMQKLCMNRRILTKKDGTTFKSYSLYSDQLFSFILSKRVIYIHQTKNNYSYSSYSYMFILITLFKKIIKFFVPRLNWVKFEQALLTVWTYEICEPKWVKKLFIDFSGKIVHD